MKKIETTISILLLISLTIFVTFGQFKDLKTFNHPCDQILSTIVFDGEQIKYQVISRTLLYTKGTFDFYESDIILPEFDSKSDKGLINRLLIKIKEIHPANEFSAFNNCDARRIFYQEMKPTEKQIKFLKESLIGHFKADNK